jgi:hypothetical protein
MSGSQSDLSKLALKSASVQQPLFMEPLPFLCHPERSRGICSLADLCWKRGILFSNKIVISTGGVTLLRPTQGDEKRLVPATTLYGISTEEIPQEITFK